MRFLSVLENTVFVTLLVMMMMVLLEYVHLGTHGGAAAFLRKHRRWEVAIGGLLGAIPGCAGGFLGVSLYAHGMLSFGALAAMMIATVGDDGLVLLALKPWWGIGIAVGMLALGIAVGWVCQLFPARGGDAGRGTESDHYPLHAHDMSHRPWGPWQGMGWRRAVLLGVLAFFFAGVACGFLGDAGAEASEAEHAAWEGGELIARVLFALMGLAAFACVWKSSEHFVDEHLWHHVVRQHFFKVFLWTLAILALVEWGSARWKDIDGVLDAKSGFWMLFGVSALLGWLPTAGPNMLVIGLFATGKLPAEALLVNSIVQDGHASLPLLAESRMQFFFVKLLKTILALAVFALWKTL